MLNCQKKKKMLDCSKSFQRSIIKSIPNEADILKNVGNEF